MRFSVIALALCACGSHETTVQTPDVVARHEARLPRAPGVNAPSFVAVANEPRGGELTTGAMLADVDSCSTCHPDVAAQWSSSAHSFASFGNPIYRFDVELVRADGRLAMRLRSDGASFALHRDVVVDLKAFPYLTWTWKVTQIPAAGDVRDGARDDQAAQLYVIFPRWPSPRTASDVIGYVWDSHAPAGTQLTHPRASNVRIVVVESGRTAIDRWQRYQRNLADDYVALFGKPAPRVGKIALMIDGNDTKAAAEAFIGDIFFSQTTAGRAEIPSIVLR